MPIDASKLPPGARISVGQTPTTTERSRLPKLEAKPDFYLMHHSNGWALEKTSKGWELLPVVKSLPLVPGANGVRVTPAGVDSAYARTKFADNGWTILRDQDAYRRAHRVAGGTEEKPGYTHLPTWEVLIAYPDGDADVQLDLEAYYDFRRSLVEDGVVSGPRPKVLRRLRRKFERRISRNSSALHVPGVAKVVEHAEESLQGLDEATSEKKPKTKSKTSKKDGE